MRKWILISLVQTWSIMVNAVDYTCLHSNSWLINENDQYNIIFQSKTDVLTSSYVENDVSSTTTKQRRRFLNEKGSLRIHSDISSRNLQSGPPPPPPPPPSDGGGGGGTGGMV
jgi:hypothetical protein